MYDVKNLLKKCVEHLRKNVDDTNAVEVWTVAEAIGHEELKKVALEHLGRQNEELLEVPGVKESFQSPQLVESLVKHLISLVPSHINVTVQCTSADGFVLIATIKVKKSVTVEKLRELTDNCLNERGYSAWKCQSGTFRHQNSADYFDADQTLKFYKLEDQSTIKCTIV